MNTEPQPATQRPCEMQSRAVSRVHARGGKPHTQNKSAGGALTDEQADEVCAAVLLLLDRLNTKLNPEVVA